MSAYVSLLNVIKSDLQKHSDGITNYYTAGALNSISDAVKGYVCKKLGVMDAKLIVESAIQWLKDNPEAMALPDTFLATQATSTPITSSDVSDVPTDETDHPAAPIVIQTESGVEN